MLIISHTAMYHIIINILSKMIEYDIYNQQTKVQF